MKTIQDYLLTIPNFPEPGMLYRDLNAVLENADGLQLAIDEMVALLEGVEFDAVAGVESRGFLLGAPIAYLLHKPFIPLRRHGKLPREVVWQEYELEYGTAIVEMHRDAIVPGQRVVLVDDLIATGATMAACTKLVEKAGGEVTKIIFLLELAARNGRKRLSGYEISSVITCDEK